MASNYVKIVNEAREVYSEIKEESLVVWEKLGWRRVDEAPAAEPVAEVAPVSEPAVTPAEEAPEPPAEEPPATVTP